MPMSWHPSMSTGVDTVDAQHKNLIQQLNDLADALQTAEVASQLTATLDFMGEYAIAHFNHEELCFRRYNCPAAEANRLAHQEFLRVFTDFRSRLDLEGPTPALAAEVEQHLMTWLMAHICGTDVKLRPCVPLRR